jgi:hypothetical protein
MKSRVLAIAFACVLSNQLAAQEVTNLDTSETFTGIQAAIDDADTLAGHTLEMDLATHSTPELQIVFTKSLTLQGTTGGTTLSPTMDTGTSGDDRGWFLVPLLETVTFQNLIFDGSPNKVHTAIRNHGTLTVDQCEFTEIQYEASGPAYNGIAISHFGSGGAPMVVTDCKFSEIGRIGLHIFEPATVERCVYTGKGVGDWLDYFTDTGSFSTSIGLPTFDACTVTNNRGVASVDGSTSAGMLISTYFGAGTDATVKNCSITDNTTGIFVGFAPTDTAVVAVSNNTIAGNDYGLVATSTTVITDAKDNWWGDVSGPEDLAGTFESEVPFGCTSASFTPALDVLNADGTGNSVTDANVDYCAWLSAAPLLADQDITPDAIFGSGNANGSWTVAKEDCVELGLRAKLRFPPSNIFNSNGDGSYTFNIGSGTSVFPNPEWAFEWSVNTDYDAGSGLFIDDLTYEIGMDFDPSANTDYLAFDHITPGEVLPYTTVPPATVFWDHAIGTNATPNGGGTVATDGPSYLALTAANNVAQNSWRTTFFDELPFVFDPDVPGRYDFYVAAFDGSGEVARTEIAVFALDGATLSLEADLCQMDQDSVTPGTQIAVELWLRNPDGDDVSGYQAFLEFDDALMIYEGGLSSYTAAPFETHIQALATAEVAAGELRLDGSTFLLPTGTTEDAHLATLAFTVTDCGADTVSFDLTQSFPSVASYLGVELTTDLLDSPAILGDAVPPVLVGTPANFSQPADAGSCTEAVVSWTDPTATDVCDPSPTVVCSPASGSTFSVGVTTVTCTATDACGNEATTTFDVTVTATNLVDVTVELTGSVPTSRCIHFMMDSCSAVADTTLTFVGSSPAVAVATVEVPCGVWTKMCAKDEQHTQWGESALTIVGAKYVASTTIVLDGGDTDNDGDIDINDVTWLLGQFGGLANAPSCPWDGVTRDADFENGGAVGSEDYSFITANWLTTSGCACTIAASGGNGPRRHRLDQWLPVRDARTAAADLNADGRVDVLDVELFEQANGLSGALSRRMRATRR